MLKGLTFYERCQYFCPPRGRVGTEKVLGVMSLSMIAVGEVDGGF